MLFVCLLVGWFVCLLGGLCVCWFVGCLIIFILLDDGCLVSIVLLDISFCWTFDFVERLLEFYFYVWKNVCCFPNSCISSRLLRFIKDVFFLFSSVVSPFFRRWELLLSFSRKKGLPWPLTSTTMARRLFFW